MREIIRVDKPKGITSFDVVRILRKELGIKKIGHAGTLDPLASGLMLVGIGPGTKKLESLLKLPKTYDVEILLGESRTTGDMEGEVVERKDVEDIGKTKMAAILDGLVGELELPVPKYSAIKVDGERLYKKARNGEDFEPPKKAMELRSYKLQNIKREEECYFIKVKMDVSSGTYIRSLVEEFGRRLGYPATTKNLRRTKIGKYRILFAKRIKSTNLPEEARKVA